MMSNHNHNLKAVNKVLFFRLHPMLFGSQTNFGESTC